MRLVLLTVCVTMVERSLGKPLFSDNKSNLTSKSVQNPDKPKQGTDNLNVDPKDNMSMDKITFIMYAGRIIAALNSDPNYESMKDRIKDPSAEGKILVAIMSMMTEKTIEKLNNIKSEQVQKFQSSNCPKDEKPNYIDFDNPHRFNSIDLHKVISKVSTMRSVLEEFIHGKKPT